MAPQYKMSIILAVIGLPMLAFGPVLANSDSVTCGNETMQPGDTCAVTKGATTTMRSYDEQKGDNQRTGWVVFGAGVLCLGGAGWYVFKGRQRNREEAESEASAGDFMAGPA